MRALIAKEWRENRLLILGFLVLAPVLSIGVKWGIVGWKDTLANHSVMIVIPGLLLLFVLGIAADLVAGDAGSGRIAFLAALPVRPGTVWAAKALFLYGAATLYLGYLLLLESAILAAAGKDAGWLFADFDDRAAYLLAIGTIGAATLCFSTLIDRGLAAVFAALTALAGIGLLVWLFDPPAYGITWKKEALVLIPVAAILIGTAFLLGSFLAFARGRVHLGSRVRRVALAAAGFLLVAAPPAAWAAAALHDWSRIQWDDRAASFGLGTVSPDGRWALVYANRSTRGPLGARRPDRPGAVFAVRTKDGVVRDVTRFGRILDESEAWRNLGRVKLVRRSLTPEGRSVWLEVDYDLESGAPLTTRPLARKPRHVWKFRSVLWEPVTPGGTRLHFRDRPPVVIPRRMAYTGAKSGWGVGLSGPGEEGEDGRIRAAFWILDSGSGERTRLPGIPHLLPAERSGDALCQLDALFWFPLAGGEPRPVPGVTPNLVASSPDGRRAVVLAKEGVYVFSAQGGDPARIGKAVPADTTVAWTHDSRRFLLTASSGAWSGRIGAAGLEPFPLPEGREWQVESFDGDLALCSRLATPRARHAIVVVSEDGTVRQLLPSE